MGCDDHGPANPLAGLDDPALDNGQFLDRTLDSKVAPGDHDRVGGRDHFMDQFYSGLIFYFRHHLRFASLLQKDSA